MLSQSQHPQTVQRTLHVCETEAVKASAQQSFHKLKSNEDKLKECLARYRAARGFLPAYAMQRGYGLHKGYFAWNVRKIFASSLFEASFSTWKFCLCVAIALTCIDDYVRIGTVSYCGVS